MNFQIFLLLLSLYALGKCADLMIAGAQVMGFRTPSLQRYLGYILGSLTSLPELAVTLASMATGHPDVAIMNIIASNAINVVFMVFQAYRYKMTRALFHAPFWDEWFFTLTGILLPFILFLNDVKSSTIAIAGIGYFIFFAFWEKKQSRKVLCEIEEPEESNALLGFVSNRCSSTLSIAFVIATGLIGITIFGALFGYSTDALISLLKEDFPLIAIGLGIIAGVGTSLPEFQSFGATFQLYSGLNEERKAAGAQSCLDNCNASSGFNYGIVYPVGVFGALLIS